MNPLKEKIGNKYQETADKLKLHPQTIRKIANLDEEGILNMRLRTYIRLKKELKVDMLKGIDYKKIQELKLTYKNN